MTEAVWLTPDYPWPGLPVGGIFHATQARALARLGLDITVVSPTPWAPWPLSAMRTRWRLYAQAPRMARDDAISVARPRYLNVPGQPSWTLPDRMIARAVWRARQDWMGAKLIHGHSVVEGLAAWRVARQAGLPLVLTFHGSDINTWPGEHPDRLADLRTAIREADAVIAVSAALAELIRAMADREVIHLPLGCDHKSLADSTVPRQVARRSLGIPDDRIVVLFVGHLVNAKGVRELADAILRVGDPFVGVFVGGGPEAGYGTGRDAADGRLRYIGELPHEDVVRCMSAADVLVLPSRGEGLPTVLVEAGSVGLPVIASPVGGIPELLGRDRGGLLPDTSAEGVASALHGFVADRDSAEAAARRLRAHVTEAYDVDINAVRLLDRYRSIRADIAMP